MPNLVPQPAPRGRTLPVPATPAGAAELPEFPGLEELPQRPEIRPRPEPAELPPPPPAGLGFPGGLQPAPLPVPPAPPAPPVSRLSHPDWWSGDERGRTYEGEGGWLDDELTAASPEETRAADATQAFAFPLFRDEQPDRYR
jgi:hypothetical protein